MPCRIGVYETKDGKVHIAEMDIGLMSKMFGGTIVKVMAKVAQEEESKSKDCQREEAAQEEEADDDIFHISLSKV